MGMRRAIFAAMKRLLPFLLLLGLCLFGAKAAHAQDELYLVDGSAIQVLNTTLRNDTAFFTLPGKPETEVYFAMRKSVACIHFITPIDQWRTMTVVNLKDHPWKVGKHGSNRKFANGSIGQVALEGRRIHPMVE